METKEAKMEKIRNDGRQNASCKRKQVMGWQFDGTQWKLGRAFDVVWLADGRTVLEVKTKRGVVRVPVKAEFVEEEMGVKPVSS